MYLPFVRWAQDRLFAVDHFVGALPFGPLNALHIFSFSILAAYARSHSEDSATFFSRSPFIAFVCILLLAGIIFISISALCHRISPKRILNTLLISSNKSDVRLDPNGERKWLYKNKKYYFLDVFHPPCRASCSLVCCSSVRLFSVGANPRVFSAHRWDELKSYKNPTKTKSRT